ncbi:MAG: 1-deoxy-D-xylulose-5-phosphate reductoisomerase [Bacteroidales bacterium]|nr:1-deoxy-D-xylulose-5-phosphate reductoisomerase [Bacteroidales bacterium]
MKQLKRIAILGSTGSIGTQTLDVISHYPDRFKVDMLIAGSKVDTLIQQAVKWRPSMAIIADTSKYWKLKDALEPLGIATASGSEAIADAMERETYDCVVTATVGYSGLAPTLRAIKAGKDIALANKETLVVAGDIVTAALRRSSSRMLPVDSEHSAIHQCLVGENSADVRRLIITASGGPFRTLTKQQIAGVTSADALKHPNWSMGSKITIDSATMMNKAFEIIEARWLFDIPGDKITPVVHPQSIVHSMVEFVDGSVKAQLGVPDMRLPIRYALGDASRLATSDMPLTLERCSQLTFEAPDADRFPAIKLGHYALEKGGNTACVINAANEIAVAAFLRGHISFTDIYAIIEHTLGTINYIAEPSYEDYVATNEQSRAVADEAVGRIKLGGTC